MQETGGMCYTPKCDTVEDDLMERASEGNPGGGLRKQVQIEMESKSKGGSRPWVRVRESQGRGKLSPSQEGSKDEEFGSTKNRVGEEIKLS
jgi:hypothetical protein